jgi:predicted permease
MASVGVLLLIACGNVANLLLSRSNVRQNELGVRVAVGAGRARLFRQLLTESVLLALLGGMLGVGLAVGAVFSLGRVGEQSLPRLAEIAVHGKILAFTTLITLTTAIVFGLLPALRLSRVNVVDVIKGCGRGSLGDGSVWSRFNLSNALIVAEIGLSLVLLIGAGLLTRSMGALQQVDPGFDAEQTLTFRYSLTGDPYGEASRRAAFVDELEASIATLPGVRSVGGGSLLPFSPGVAWGTIAVEGYVPPTGEDEDIIADFHVVTPGYFPTMGISLLTGRTFDELDRDDGLLVAIVDQRFAAKAFADRNPIGGRIRAIGNEWAEVVGVAEPVKQDALDSDEQHYAVYYSHAQVPLRRMYSTVKTSVEPGSLVGAVRQIVSDMDDRVAVVDVSSMSHRVADSLAERRFSMLMLRVFSVVALILAAVGIYGLISYRVSQGVHELGMRMALGAPSRAIMKLVLVRGMLLAVVGVALGLLGAVNLTTMMTTMLYDVSPTDGLTYSSVSVFLLVTVCVACFVPARRAAAVDPLEALRAE